MNLNAFMFFIMKPDDLKISDPDTTSLNPVIFAPWKFPGSSS